VLKKLSIDELEVGMFLDSIAEQQGNMKIKSRGRVSSGAILRKLKSQGILSVVIDLSKQITPAIKEPETKAPPPEEPEEKKPLVKFEDEIGKASKLHQQGKGIQKRMLDSVSKGLPVDVAISEEFIRGLVASIGRNPNALVCMTKIREKDTYLLEHSLNVAILLANLASHVGFSEAQTQELALSGFLHDIGKIKVPDEILHKPGRLTDSEMEIMKSHVNEGTAVLTEMGIPKRIVRTIGEHHERLDGGGYPEGKKGDEISLSGRMIAIIDTYDAITADRCYKVGMSSKKALQILLQDSPDKYDQRLVNKFIQCIGIYPVGSLVKLTNERIAMVVRQNKNDATKPLVKVFYSLRGNHYLPPTELDLGLSKGQIKIEEAVLASDFKMDFNKYFSETIAV
jgi:putative nucleotidyltransferase with HDIG domain